MTDTLDFRQLQYARQDEVGHTLRNKRRADLLEGVLADGLDDPGNWWRHLADQQTDTQAADRLRAIAELVEGLGL